MSYDLGGSVALEAKVVGDDGTPANAATATLTLTLPDGTTESPVVAAPTTVGTYGVRYTPTQAGLHAVRWTFEDPDRVVADVFNVRPTTYGQLISVADAKLHMNKTAGVDDEELRLMIVAATSIVEREVGAVVRQQHVESHRGGQAVALGRRPVLEVDSITYASDGSQAADVAAVRVDAESGVLWSTSGSLPDARLTITYTAGRLIVPESMQLACAIIVEHLWKTQRGHSARPGLFGQQVEQPSNEEQAIAYYSGFALPHRAAELLAGDADVAGGIA